MLLVYLFPRLPWWGRERGGEEGGRVQGEGLEEDMSVGESTKSTVHVNTCTLQK